MPKANKGAGLGALLGSNRITLENIQNSAPGEKVLISLIDPNPYQPRKIFDEEKLKDLAESIKKHGVLQPVLVRIKEDGRYELIAGERRYRASKIAGLEYIPVNIKSLTNQESLEIALIENIQREDINPVETAVGYRRLMDEFGYTQEDLSKVIGKNRSTIANTLRLLSLPESVQNLITYKKLSEGHGRAILSVPEDKREEFAQIIIGRDYSVRQAEEYAMTYKKSKIINPEPAKTINPAVNNAKKTFVNFFGKKVKLTEKDGKGKIVISFDSGEELNNLVTLLKDKK